MPRGYPEALEAGEAEEARPRLLKTAMGIRCAQFSLATIVLGLTGTMFAHDLDQQSPRGNALTTEVGLLLCVGAVAGGFTLWSLAFVLKSCCHAGLQDWLDEGQAAETRRSSCCTWYGFISVELLVMILSGVALYFSFSGLSEEQCVSSPDFTYKGLHTCSIVLAAWFMAVFAQILALAAIILEVYRVHYWSREVDKMVVTRGDGRVFDRDTGRWEIS